MLKHIPDVHVYVLYPHIWEKKFLMYETGNHSMLVSKLWNYEEKIKHFNIRKATHKYVKVSVQFSRWAVSDSLWPHGLQHAKPPCPSPIPRVYSNSCPLSRWCHQTISSCYPLLLPPSTFPSIRVFSNESVSASVGQSIWVSASASASVLPIQDWFPLGLSGLISL